MIYREPILHLAVNKTFTYLNYLSVMSAIRGNNVKVWIGEEPTGRYWELIKKVQSIRFENLDPATGMTVSWQNEDKTGRMDIIYLGELNDSYVNEAMVDHKGLYDVDGEFETKDMCLVRVFKPELVTPEYVKTSNTLLANLIKRVLLERVWDQ